MDRLLNIKVQTNSKQEKIEELPGGVLKIWVNAVPEKGEANERVLKLIAKKFNIPVSCIKIIKGTKGKSKRILIKGENGV